MVVVIDDVGPFFFGLDRHKRKKCNYNIFKREKYRYNTYKYYTGIIRLYRKKKLEEEQIIKERKKRKYNK